jgi:hypothetical protein
VGSPAAKEYCMLSPVQEHAMNSIVQYPRLYDTILIIDIIISMMLYNTGADEGKSDSSSRIHFFKSCPNLHLGCIDFGENRKEKGD